MAKDIRFGTRKLIRFRRLHKAKWEIAFSQEHLDAKLNGETAEVIMPAKSLIVRLWRLFFPLRGLSLEADGQTHEVQLG